MLDGDTVGAARTGGVVEDEVEAVSVADGNELVGTAVELSVDEEVKVIAAEDTLVEEATDTLAEDESELEKEDDDEDTESTEGDEDEVAIVLEELGVVGLITELVEESGAVVVLEELKLVLAKDTELNKGVETLDGYWNAPWASASSPTTDICPPGERTTLSRG